MLNYIKYKISLRIYVSLGVPHSSRTLSWNTLLLRNRKLPIDGGGIIELRILRSFVSFVFLSTITPFNFAQLHYEGHPLLVLLHTQPKSGHGRTRQKDIKFFRGVAGMCPIRFFLNRCNNIVIMQRKKMCIQKRFSLMYQ